MSGRPSGYLFLPSLSLTLSLSLLPPSPLSPSLSVSFLDCLISSYKHPVINLLSYSFCFVLYSVSLPCTYLTLSLSFTYLPDVLRLFFLFPACINLLHYVFLPTSHLALLIHSPSLSPTCLSHLLLPFLLFQASINHLLPFLSSPALLFMFVLLISVSYFFLLHLMLLLFHLTLHWSFRWSRYLIIF